jgi:hypothetical protein
LKKYGLNTFKRVSSLRGIENIPAVDISSNSMFWLLFDDEHRARKGSDGVGG